MSRFHNLEFSDAKPKSQSGSDRSVTNEGSCLAGAQIAFEEGRFADALQAYSKTLEFNPQSEEAWAGQVRMLIELGEHHEASIWADRALESCPSSAGVLAVKAVTLARQGDLAAALTFSDAAVANGSEQSYVWLSRADVLLARRENTAAYCFDKALTFSPVKWFTLWLISRILAFHRQFALALQQIQLALESGAGHAVVWNQLGQCRYQLGMKLPAREAFTQALELQPDSVSPETMRELQEGGWGNRLLGWWRRLSS